MKDKVFNSLKQLFKFIRNLIYVSLVTFMVFFIGLVVIPGQILNAIEILKNLF